MIKPMITDLYTCTVERLTVLLFLYSSNKFGLYYIVTLKLWH